MNDFDSNEATDTWLVSAENRRHSAFADFFDDLVRSEPSSDHKKRQRPVNEGIG